MKKLIENVEFVTAWSYYNDYLLEKHVIKLSETEKNEQLNMIEKLSKNNVETAMEILEINISNGNSVIIMPSVEEFI